tara:strand:+ start:179 stop:409 length:231 start_codon:yes stop_codon:yes gene_type:complete
MKAKKRGIRLPYFGLIFLIFLTLKLAEIGVVATWSWWWVTCPLWILPAIIMFFMSMSLCFVAFVFTFVMIFGETKK